MKLPEIGIQNICSDEIFVYFFNSSCFANSIYNHFNLVAYLLLI
jgi:hypothetical protein